MKYLLFFCLLLNHFIGMSQTTIIRDTLKVGDSAVVTVTTKTTTQAVGTATYTYPVNNTSISQYKIPLSTTSPANHPPISSLGADISLTLPNNSTTLNGTQSSDPDGDPITYAFQKIGGPQQFTLTAVSTGIVSLTQLVQGTYTFKLVVTDDKGASSSDDVNIVVSAAPTGGQEFQLSFAQLTGDYSRPAGGFEWWYNAYEVNPGVTSQDRYIRFNWAGLNPQKGVFNWSAFNTQINTAIDNGQKFSFGLMTQYLGGQGSVGIANYGGGYSAYPQWLNTEMQAESVKPVLNDGDWVPNYNSPAYLSAYEVLLQALYAHLSTTTYKGVLYKNAINFIDIRGYGNFGEWHNWPYGTGTPSTPTATTLKRIVDAHKNAFPDIRLSAMISGVSAVDVWSAVTPEVAYYLLTERNAAGDFGIRRDNWGATEAWYNQDAWENNPKSYNGVQLKNLIMNKWKTAPITGEPCCNSGYAQLPAQALKYHLLSVGNSNYGSRPSTSTAATASKNMGYRITLTGGKVTTNTGSLGVSLNWSSTGTTPTYEVWDVIYELRQGTTVVRSLKSTFSPTLLLTTQIAEDNFTGLPSGTYDLRLKIVNPSGYRTLPLSIANRQSDGTYILKTGITL